MTLLEQCLEVNNACANYYSFLTSEQKEFINCGAIDENGEAKFEDGGNCYSLLSLSPLPRCGNATSPDIGNYYKKKKEKKTRKERNKKIHY